MRAWSALADGAADEGFAPAMVCWPIATRLSIAPGRRHAVLHQRGQRQGLLRGGQHRRDLLQARRGGAHDGLFGAGAVEGRGDVAVAGAGRTGRAGVLHGAEVVGDLVGGSAYRRGDGTPGTLRRRTGLRLRGLGHLGRLRLGGRSGLLRAILRLLRLLRRLRRLRLGQLRRGAGLSLGIGREPLRLGLGRVGGLLRGARVLLRRQDRLPGLGLRGLARLRGLPLGGVRRVGRLRGQRLGLRGRVHAGRGERLQLLPRGGGRVGQRVAERAAHAGDRAAHAGLRAGTPPSRMPNASLQKSPIAVAFSAACRRRSASTCAMAGTRRSNSSPSSHPA